MSRSFAKYQSQVDREARRIQRELEKQLRNQEKLSERERARLDVETHRNGIEVLLSIHKECGRPVDWSGYALALPEHRPPDFHPNESVALVQYGGSGQARDAVMSLACSADEQIHAAALAAHEQRVRDAERLRDLARRVLAGEPGAYSEAATEFGSFAELSTLGSSLELTVHSPSLVECSLTVRGRDLIPAETKTLTAAGKVSVKAMPKARFHEIYQDYVCSCILRVARELFSFLPTQIAIVTAKVEEIDSRTGVSAEYPVLSVAVTREKLDALDFELLDPSDALENFFHRGDAKASKKAGEFAPIQPIEPAEIRRSTDNSIQGLGILRQRIRELRADMQATREPVTNRRDQQQPTDSE